VWEKTCEPTVFPDLQHIGVLIETPEIYKKFKIKIIPSISTPLDMFFFVFYLNSVKISSSFNKISSCIAGKEEQGILQVARS
jgi:hypothetical protein